MRIIRDADSFYKIGEAILVGSSLVVGGYGIVSKVVARYQAAGNVPALDARLTHVEHKTAFLVKGMEKLTHSHYERDSDEQ